MGLCSRHTCQSMGLCSRHVHLFMYLGLCSRHVHVALIIPPPLPAQPVSPAANAPPAVCSVRIKLNKRVLRTTPAFATNHVCVHRQKLSRSARCRTDCDLILTGPCCCVFTTPCMMSQTSQPQHTATMSSPPALPGAPDELPRVSGAAKRVGDVARAKTPRRRTSNVTGFAEPGDAVTVKQGGRQDISLIAMGIFCFVLVVVFGIVLSYVANARCSNTDWCGRTRQTACQTGLPAAPHSLPHRRLWSLSAPPRDGLTMARARACRGHLGAAGAAFCFHLCVCECEGRVCSGEGSAKAS